MKNSVSILLKVVIAAATGVVIIHLWPAAIIPLVLLLLAAIGLMASCFVCLLVVGAVGGGVFIGLLAALAVLLALLSPLWVPAALIVGIIMIVNKLSRSKSSRLQTA